MMIFVKKVVLTLPSVYFYPLTCLKSSLVTRTTKILPLVVTMIMLNPILLLLVVLLIPLMILLAKLHLEQENSILKEIIEKGVYKSLAGSKQFEEIVRKQGRRRKNQGVGFERKFNANGVEWEEDQYPKTKFVPQQEKYDPTSFKGTQAQDDLPPQDYKQKGKDKLQEEIDAFEEAPKTIVKCIPKTTSSSTSSSTNTTPRIPIKMVWIQKKKN